MFKFSLPVLFGLVLCLPVTAFANLDQPLQALDDHALSAEYGQSNTLNLVQDQYGFTAQDLVNQVRFEQNQDLASIRCLYFLSHPLHSIIQRKSFR